jgi:hypothetical protein
MCNIFKIISLRVYYVLKKITLRVTMNPKKKIDNVIRVLFKMYYHLQIINYILKQETIYYSTNILNVATSMELL